MTQRTFKPLEPRDQRWYNYNSHTDAYTIISKSQKHHHQRMDCIARRRAAQEVLVTKWQAEEMATKKNSRQNPQIMTELLQGKKVIDRDFETEVEESEKRIKLLLRPGEKKARFEHSRKEAESKLSLPPQ